MKRSTYKHLLSASTLAADLLAFERMVATRPLQPGSRVALPPLALPAAVLEPAGDARRVRSYTMKWTKEAFGAIAIGERALERSWTRPSSAQVPARVAPVS